MSPARRRGVDVTIQDVAKQARVSVMTVSRVMNGSPHVAAATRTRIQEVVANLGFVPNLAARSLRSQRSLWIALVFQRTAGEMRGDPGYVVELQEGVIQRCLQHGYHAAVEVLSHDSATAAAELRELTQQLAPDGIVLAPPLSSSAALLAQLREAGVPCIGIAPRSVEDAGPCVVMDDRAAAQQMTEYLLSLGHRRIAFVEGVPEHVASAQRRGGYEAALAGWGVPLCDELIVPGDFTFEGGRRALAALLQARAAATAIFASNDESAAGCLAEARSRGLRVPGDVSVAGFDDTYVATRLYPPLTTIRQPIREMGQAAVGQLLGMIDGATPGVIRLAHRLVERQSAAAPPGAPTR